MTIPIHAVFQGGGARLAALLAAAEALQGLEATNDLRIASVSGTSAGSIIAAMVATGQPIERFKHRLKPLFDKHYTTFCSVKTQRRLRHSVVRFILPSHLRPAHSVILGEPLFNEDEFRRFVDSLFTIDAKKYKFLTDLEIPITITATDLRNQRRLDYDRISKDTLVDALVNSCSIPFAFRTFADSTMIVDGGVCANLPTPQIKASGETDSLPVAFSFPNEAFAQKADSVITYAKLLVSSAMQNSINEACHRVEIMGGKVVRIDSPLTTFDFEGAVNYVDGEKYSLNKNQVRSEIAEWLQGINIKKRHQRYTNSNDNIRFLNKCFYEIFECFYSPESVKIGKAAIIVTANCLFPRSHPRALTPDQVEHLIELYPKIEALRAFSVTTFGMSEGDLGREWSVTTEKLVPVKAICVPLVKPEQNDRFLTSIMAMFFDPPLSKNEGTYKFRHVAAQADSMAGLVSEGMDFGWHQSGQSAEIDVSDFVIRIPRQFGKITLDDLEENIGRIPYEKRPNVVLGNTPGSWRKGREMTAVELEPYQAGDFRCVGWRATQMKSGDRMGMILTRASTP